MHNLNKLSTWASSNSKREHIRREEEQDNHIFFSKIPCAPKASRQERQTMTAEFIVLAVLDPSNISPVWCQTQGITPLLYTEEHTHTHRTAGFLSFSRFLSLFSLHFSETETEAPVFRIIIYSTDWMHDTWWNTFSKRHFYSLYLHAVQVCTSLYKVKFRDK